MGKDIYFGGSGQGAGTSNGDVTLDGAQELTNKTIDGEENTLQNIPAAAIKGSDTEALSFKTFLGQSLTGNGALDTSGLGGNGGGSGSAWDLDEDFTLGINGTKLVPVVTNGGSLANISPTINGAAGMIALLTGANAAGGYFLGSFLSAIAAADWTSDVIYTWEGLGIKLPTVSDGTNTFSVPLGFTDIGNASLPNNGACFRVNPNSNLIEMIVAAAGNRTIVSTDITWVNNAYYDFRIEIECGNTKEVRFYINGTINPNGTFTTASYIPQSTDATGSFGFGIGILKQLGTTSRRVDIDRMRLKTNFYN